jgi:hypothetical protein
MRTAVLDEAELAGLPPRVAAIARSLALTSCPRRAPISPDSATRPMQMAVLERSLRNV